MSVTHLSELVLTILLWVQGLGSLGAIAFILIYIIATIALVPGSILTLGAGLLFGVAWGSVYVLIGAAIGETCAFLLGRYLLRNWVEGKIARDQKFLTLDRALNRSGLKIILLTRLSPIFPFSLLNYAFGITGISLKDYFLGSIGMIPMTVVYVYFGSLAGDLATIGTASQLANPELQWIIKIIGFIATVTCTVYVTRTAHQALNRSLEEVPQQDNCVV
ncbi:MAG: TVP38/TMEM64 family protein [Cyanobacteria bacterium J06600_6]